MLADGFHDAGHRVVVVTDTPSEVPEPFPYPVVRRPGPRELLGLTRWCDVFFQANVSLKGLWPLAFVRRPWVVSHHSWYRLPDGRLSLRDRIKRHLLRHAAASIAVSRAMADDVGTGSVVIENPYRDDLFRLLPGVVRDRDLVFVGRLVSDKGADLLVEAIARLRAAGVQALATLVGAGPEEPELRRQIAGHGLGDQIELAGPCGGEDLVRVLNRHRVMVVPSRYNEPFGIVALEGLACGCAVVGSAGGGLADAIGACGWTFPNRNVEALARLLGDVLRRRVEPPAAEVVAAHLARHTRGRVCRLYLDLLEAIPGTAGASSQADSRPR